MITKQNKLNIIAIILLVVISLLVGLSIYYQSLLLSIILAFGLGGLIFLFIITKNGVIKINYTNLFMIVVCLSIVGQFLSLVWISTELRSIQLYRVIAISLIILFIGLCFIKKDNILTKFIRSNVKYYLAFILFWGIWLIISISWGLDHIYSAQITLIYICSMFLTFSIPIVINDKPKLKKLLITLLIMVIITYVVALLEKAGIKAPIAKTFSDDTDFYGSRMGSFFGNPNNLALYASTFILPFTLFSLVFYKHLYHRLIIIFLLIITMFIVILSASRSCLLAMGVSIITAIFLMVKYKLINVPTFVIINVTTVLMLVLTIILCIQLLPYSAILKFSFIFENPDYLFSDSPRQILLFGVLDIIQSNKIYILSGVGVGSFDIFFNMIDLFPNHTRQVTSLHNWWLQVFADGGIFIFILYNFFYFSILYQLSKIIQKTNDLFLKFIALSLNVSFVSFIVGSVASSGVYQFTPLWIQWGIALAVINIYRKKEFETTKASLT